MKKKSIFEGVLITPEAKIKMDAWVGMSPGEVSGLGQVRVVKKGLFLIEDVFLLKQTCTGSHTVLNSEAIAALMMEMIQSGVDMSLLRLWWHSHADFAVSWSPTDNNTIAGFNNNWMLSLVTNYSRDYMCRVDSYDPIHMTANYVPFDVLLDVSEERLTELSREFSEKVTFVVPKPPVKKGVYIPNAKTTEDGLFPTEGASLPGENGGYQDCFDR